MNAETNNNSNENASAGEYENDGGAGGGVVDGSLDFASAGGDGEFVVTSEQKKPLNRTTLVLVGVIVLGGGLLYFMHLRTGPQAASAAAAQSATANATINQFLS